MTAVSTPLSGPLFVAVVLVLLYTLRYMLLPKPLPHIPYNTNAANKLLGDVPELVSHVIRTKRIFVRPLRSLEFWRIPD
jgi:hypothetical protein